MARREKIILAVMAIAVIIGGYDFLFNSSSKNTPVIKKKSAAELTGFVTSVITGIKKKDTKSEYIIGIASLDWAKDPFLQFDPVAESTMNIGSGRNTGENSPLIYSGFLNMGGKALAVINGVEYEEGENLENGAYLIEKIFPAKVVLRSSSGSKSVTLFLDEAY